MRLRRLFASIAIAALSCLAGACHASQPGSPAPSSSAATAAPVVETPDSTLNPSLTSPQPSAVPSTTAPSSTPGESVTPPAIPGSPTPPALLTIGERENGQAIILRVGTSLTVGLGSYWTFAIPTDPRVLKVTFGPATSPSGSCPPGVGCGGVFVTYQAVGIGSAEISASRTLCGEAFRCPAEQTSFKVPVTVTGQ